MTPSPELLRRRLWSLALLGLLGLLATVGVAGAQTAAVQADFGSRWVAADEVLPLQLDPALAPRWRELRVFHGSNEVTALLRATAVPGRLELVPGAVRWTSGEGELVLVDGQTWTELARLPLRVLTAGGFESQTLQPRLDVSTDGRARERRNDGQPLSPRGSHADGATQAGLGWQAARGDWRVEAGIHTSGNSHREKALRYGELNNRAPKLDLADYRVALAHGQQRIEFGHLGGRVHPLLAQDLARRGVALHGSLGALGDLSLHLVNGSQIVGWDNALGLDDADHRLQLLSWGLELLPDRPGGLRAEVGLLDASVQPRGDFNAGSVPDAERSRGLALRLAGHSANGRVRGELAVARSRFVNPYDPLLALDGELQAVQPATRNAFAGELHLQLLQPDGSVAWHPALSLSLRHEQAAPLYRSLAAAVTPDQRATRLAAQLSLAGAALTLQRQQRMDNLARVTTLLRTRTAETQATLTLPLARWFGGEQPHPAWPSSSSWSWQHVHQLAANTPLAEDSGFAASQRPDQVNVVQQLQLNWALPRGSVGWNLSRTLLDNRQPGRERADSSSLSQQWQLAWAFSDRWQGQWGLQQGRQLNLETAVEQHIAGATTGLDWRPDERWSLGGSAGLNRGRDSTGLARSRSVTWQAQLARRFDLPGIGKPLPAQLTLRLARQTEMQRDDRFGLAVDWRGWWVDIGLAVGFF